MVVSSAYSWHLGAPLVGEKMNELALTHTLTGLCDCVCMCGFTVSGLGIDPHADGALMIVATCVGLGF